MDITKLPDRQSILPTQVVPDRMDPVTRMGVGISWAPSSSQRSLGVQRVRRGARMRASEGRPFR